MSCQNKLAQRLEASEDNIIMQLLKVGHVFVYILGLRMVDVVCTFPEVGDRKFMKTHHISGEMPLNRDVSLGISGGRLPETCKER